METRANHVLVGAFTLLVFAAAVGFVLWFTAAAENRERAIYRVQFQGSVSGLTPGSGVLFNGIRVGEVTNLNFDPQDPARVVARIEVFLNTPIRTDTTAKLEITGLTGGSVVQLAGGAQNAEGLPRVTTQDGDPNNAPVIVAEPSAFQDILQSARDVLQKANTTFGDIQGLVGNSRGSIERSLLNVEQFTAALSANSDDLKSFLQNTGVAARQIGVLADNLVPLVTDVQNLVRAVDVAKVDRTMTNVVAFSESLKDGGPQVEKALGDIAALAEQLRASGGRVDGILQGVQTMIAAVDAQKVGGAVDRFAALLDSIDPAKVASVVDSVESATRRADQTIAAFDPEKITRAVDGLTQVATSIDGATISRTVANLDRVVSAVDGAKIKSTVDDVSAFAAALGRNAGNIDRIASDTQQISSRLTGTTERLDRTIAAFDPEKITRAVDGLTQVATSIDGATISRTVANLDRVVSAVDGDKIRSTVNDVSAFAAALGRNSGNIDRIATDTQQIASRLTGTADRLDRTIAAVDPEKINRAVDGFTSLATSIDGPTISRTVANIDRTVAAIDGEKIRATVDNVSGFAAALGRNTDNIDQIVADAAQISSRLTGTADRLDQVIAEAQKVIGSGETQGAIAEFRNTAEAIRTLALKLDGRTAEITSGINRLSGSGVRDLQGFAADGRRTLGELERVLRNLERNPRQFLFGGTGNVQEYRGR